MPIILLIILYIGGFYAEGDISLLAAWTEFTGTTTFLSSLLADIYDERDESMLHGACSLDHLHSPYLDWAFNIAAYLFPCK